MSEKLFEKTVTRRGFLHASSATAGVALLSACSTMGGSMPIRAVAPSDPPLPDNAIMYAPLEDSGFSVPAVPYQQIDPQFLRQIVRDPTGEPPGSLVVDTASHHLYLVRPNGFAIRYGVGLGRAGFEWSGRANIQWKQKWPKWTPPDEMIARDPSLAKWSADNGGQPGGLKNPLGARALYIFQDGQDTLFRVHGSPEWKSIGRSVSSGCVRMMNQDVIDLYDRVPGQAPILVKGGGGADLVATAGPGLAIDSGIPEGSVLLGRVY